MKSTAWASTCASRVATPSATLRERPGVLVGGRIGARFTKESLNTMDLTKTYPRSVREEFAGVVMLARATDKGRAFAEGKNGEYNYNCPMDQAVFGFLGIDKDVYLAKLKQLDDAKLEQWVKETYVSRKSAAEIAQWNAAFLQRSPEKGSDSEAYFVNLRNQVAPGRTDVTTWPDLLDLDEKRPVPVRA
ncbi:DUF5069 domain-containing protein [bacterium]|nr:MAG: DUF5069 domain-containing protein [bacterium]